MRSVAGFARILIAILLISAVTRAAHAQQQLTESQLVAKINSPVSDILQVTLQDIYAPTFYGPPGGQGNGFSIITKIPVRANELIPWNEMMLLTMPTAITRPGDPTGFGDMRLLNLIAPISRPDFDLGFGPTFIFPTAGNAATGQGKWQIGPAAGVVWTPDRWLLGTIVQNPISVGGDPGRPNANEMILWPFITYNLGHGWFVRSEPQMVFDWIGGGQLIPVNLGIGKVFNWREQWMSWYVEPGWNTVHEGAAPQYTINFGFAVVFPRFWHEFN